MISQPTRPPNRGGDSVSCTLDQQVHEQLDQIVHNPQQDRDHHSAQNTLWKPPGANDCVIITMTPARHIRFCGADAYKGGRGSTLRILHLVRHGDLVETHKFQGPETEASLALVHCLEQRWY